MANQKKKILIIEDESILVEVLTKKLVKEGYQVCSAGDGQAGMERIKKEKPDLILLDIIMPKMNGYEVLRALYDKFGREKMPPVIIISNSGQPVEIEKARDLGARDFIIKAEFTPEEVTSKVNKLMGLVSSAAGNSDVGPAGEKTDNKVLTTAAGEKEARVLIVEDDQFLRDLLKTKLEKENFEVITAIDGPTGLEKVVSTQPEIILLDIILPGVDGFEILKRVRSNANLQVAKTPIILLSNLGQESNVEKGREMGANDYLIKSNFTIDEIIEKIRAILHY